MRNNTQDDSVIFIGIDAGSLDSNGAITEIKLSRTADARVVTINRHVIGLKGNAKSIVNCINGLPVFSDRRNEKMFILLLTPNKAEFAHSSVLSSLSFWLWYGRLSGKLSAHSESSCGRIKLTSCSEIALKKRWSRPLGAVKKRCKDAKLGKRVAEEMKEREIFEIAKREIEARFGEIYANAPKESARATLLAILCMERNMPNLEECWHENNH